MPFSVGRSCERRGSVGRDAFYTRASAELTRYTTCWPVPGMTFIVCVFRQHTAQYFSRWLRIISIFFCLYILIKLSFTFFTFSLCPLCPSFFIFRLLFALVIGLSLLLLLLVFLNISLFRLSSSIFVVSPRFF